MAHAQRMYRLLLLVGLGILPLLLAGWSVSSDMAHGSWFYVLTFLIPVFGLASAYHAVRHRLTPSPSRQSADVPARRAVTTNAPTTYSALLTVALPSSGPEMLRVAQALAPPDQLHVTAMHCWPEARFRAQAFEGRGHRARPEPLRPLLEAAGEIPVDPLCFVSADVGSDIVSMAEERGADLVLMGWHAPVTHVVRPSDPVQAALQRAPADVAIYLARQFRPWRRVLVPYFGGPHDRAALEMARRIARNAGVKVTILHVVPPGRHGDVPRKGLSEATEDFKADRVHLKIAEHPDPVEAAVAEAWLGYDLLIVGASEMWGLEASLFTDRHERLAFATAASLLVVRKYTKALQRQHERTRQAS